MCKIRVANCEFDKCQNAVSSITFVMTACSVFRFNAQDMIYISAFFLTYISYILQYGSSDKHRLLLIKLCHVPFLVLVYP